MKYYKDSQNRVYAFAADGSQDDYINPSLESITSQEADELANPPETPEQIVERLKSELDAIERAEIMPRKTREIQIQLMEFLAVQQGITPEQLAMNPAYTGMKEIDAQCAALRQQIRDLS